MVTPEQLQLATTAKIRAAAAAAVQAEQEMIQLQQHQQRLFIHQQASQVLTVYSF